MNYKEIINYIAAEATDSKESHIDILNHLNSILKTHYSEFELSIYIRVLIDQLKSKVIESERILQTALELGTPKMTIDFTLLNESCTRDLSKTLKLWKFSIVYFEGILNLPKQPVLSLNFDTLPDYISPAELTKLMGWTESTIATKHSKGELACVEGTRLTPKQGLKDYLEKRTKGLMDKPDEWFQNEILSKKPKKNKINK
jgi:hypothetical protein